MLIARSRLVRQAPWLVLLSLIGPPSLTMAAQLTLTWTDNAGNESGYRVERKIGSGGSYSEIAVLAANTTAYTDPNVAASTTYCYRVRAFNAAGVSGYSNEACSATAQGTLNLTVTKSGAGSVSSSPGGINCGSDCTEAFPSGAVVTLTATPSAGSRFDGWSSGGCAGTGSCTLSGNGSPMVTATFTATGASCPTGQFRAEYFNNTTLAGAPVLTRCEGPIQYEWGAGGPGGGVAVNQFSVRWTGRFDFVAATYVFGARADDGVRVWVDGTQVIAAWRDQLATTYQATRAMTAGSHEVRMEYYDNNGVATASLGWQAQAASSCPTGQFRAEYFGNLTLSGPPAFTRCETSVQHNWSSGGPGVGLASDFFSVRWTGRFAFAGGNTTFTVLADDGIRLWVDGTPVIDAWNDQGTTTYKATRSLTSGQHDIRVEYYERTGQALIQINW